MRMKKRMLVAMGLSALLSMNAFAADIDTMTLEELKEAYTQLESEKDELEEQVKDLKVQLFDLQVGGGTAAEEIETEAVELETEADAVLMKEEDFFNDILESYSARQIISDRYTNAEINTLSDEEIQLWHKELVEKELSYMAKYENAVFDDLNIQYLCKRYVNGLLNQKKAYELYFEGGDANKVSDYWSSGYNSRCYVIVELSEYYEIPFPASSVAVMKEQTEALDSLNEAETRNASVDHETVRKTQELLNGIGFFCGAADGVSGKRTVKSIKRFQEMYGFDPIDGIIDDELVEQLQSVYDEKNPVEEVAETETEE